MHTDYRSILLALGVCACSEPFQGGSGIDLLPDLLSDLDTAGCDDVDGVTVEGASSYFLPLGLPTRVGEQKPALGTCPA